MFGGKRGRLLPVLCAGALLLAACGDDGGESTAKEKPKVAAANEPTDVFIERMAKLLETTTSKKDCAQLEEINARSVTTFSCPADKALRKSMASFEIVGAESYGTGAVVDYKSGKVKDGAAILLFVATDRNWGVSRFGIVTEPSTKTSDEDSRAGYGKAVDKYLAAVRERDCKAFEQVAYTGGVEKKDVCKESFAATEPLAKRLEANPSAEPSYEGGNATYGFYTLETQKPEPASSTISVVKAPNGSGAPDAGESYIVLDVVPSPTAAEQRQVLEEFRQQQREEKQGDPSMKPSSKPKDPAVSS